MAEHRLDALREALPLVAATDQGLAALRADGVDTSSSPVRVAPATADEAVVFDMPEGRIDGSPLVLELAGAGEPHVLDDRVTVHRLRTQRSQQKHLQMP